MIVNHQCPRKKWKISPDIWWNAWQLFYLFSVSCIIIGSINLIPITMQSNCNSNTELSKVKLLRNRNVRFKCLFVRHNPCSSFACHFKFQIIWIGLIGRLCIFYTYTHQCTSALIFIRSHHFHYTYILRFTELSWIIIIQVESRQAKQTFETLFNTCKNPNTNNNMYDSDDCIV